MSLLNIDDDETSSEIEVHTSEELDMNIVSSRELDIDNLASYISGLPWTVTYYNQIVSPNDTLQLPDINLPINAIKYRQIEKLIIFLDSGLPSGEVNEITGTAVINAGIIPNYGDVIYANISGGIPALLIIDKAEKKHYNNHYIYYISFKLHSLVNEEAIVLNDLIYKSTEKYVYDENHINTKSTPLLLTTEVVSREKIAGAMTDMLDYYLKTMMDKESNVLRLPTESYFFVDTSVVEFLLKLVSVKDHPLISRLTLNSSDGFNLGDNTLFNILLNKRKDRLKIANTDIGFKTIGNYFSNSKIGKDLRYLGVSHVLVGDDSDYTIPVMKDNPLYDVDKDIVIENIEYIFSNNFYDLNIEACNDIELLVIDYLDNKVLDMEKLSKLVDEYPYWSYGNQFYIIPILYMLCKYSLIGRGDKL